MQAIDINKKIVVIHKDRVLEFSLESLEASAAIWVIGGQKSV